MAECLLKTLHCFCKNNMALMCSMKKHYLTAAPYTLTACYSRIGTSETKPSRLCNTASTSTKEHKLPPISRYPTIQDDINSNGFYYHQHLLVDKTMSPRQRSKMMFKSIISLYPQSDLVHSSRFMKQKYQIWNNSVICHFSSSANRSYCKESTSTTKRNTDYKTTSGVSRDKASKAVTCRMN